MATAAQSSADEPAGSETPMALTDEQIAELDSYIEEVREAWRVPGLAIAIVQNDEIVYMKGFGKRDIARDLPVTPDTIFVGASTTKAFASASVGLLVDDGMLSWDDPVQDYLPTFNIADKATGAQITLRDMLSHRTGMPRHDSVWYNNSTLSRADLLQRLPHLESSAPLRSKWQYNNMMYMMAGHVVETTVGKQWEQFTAERLFKPLGMTRTNFSIAEMERDPNHARAYTLDDDQKVVAIPLRPVDFIGPAGSINGSVRDYANWTKLHLNGGMFEGEQIISKNAIEATHFPVLPVGGKPEFPDFSPTLYAMGWFVDTYRGHTRVQHGGNLDGATARVTLFPNLKMSVVTFVNMEASPLPGHLSLDVLDRVAQLTPHNWSRKMIARRNIAESATSEAAERLDELRVPDTQPAHATTAYAGTYSDAGYGDWTFAAQPDGSLSGTYNQMTAKFSHWHFEQFKGEALKEEDDVLDDLVVKFVTDLHGRVSGVEIVMDQSVPPIEFKLRADESLSDPAVLGRYVGEYSLQGQTISVALNGDTLVLTVPGQSPYELEPDVEATFILASARSISARFTSENGKVTSLQMLQPNGVFEAKRVTSDATDINR